MSHRAQAAPHIAKAVKISYDKYIDTIGRYMKKLLFTTLLLCSTFAQADDSTSGTTVITLPLKYKMTLSQAKSLCTNLYDHLDETTIYELSSLNGKPYDCNLGSDLISLTLTLNWDSDR